MAKNSAATLAAATGIPRGGDISLVALLALLLVAFWLASFHNVVRSAERCLAVEGSVWGDDECRFSIKCFFTVASVSLTLTLVLRFGAAAAGSLFECPEYNFWVRHCDEEDLRCTETELALCIAFFYINLLLGVIIIAGKIAQHAGDRRLLEDPADEGAASLDQHASIYCNAGFFGFNVQHCFVVTPCSLLSLTRYLRENCVRSQMVDARIIP